MAFSVAVWLLNRLRRAGQGGQETGLQGALEAIAVRSFLLGVEHWKVLVLSRQDKRGGDASKQAMITIETRTAAVPQSLTCRAPPPPAAPAARRRPTRCSPPRRCCCWGWPPAGCGQEMRGRERKWVEMRSGQDAAVCRVWRRGLLAAAGEPATTTCNPVPAVHKQVDEHKSVAVTSPQSTLTNYTPMRLPLT